MTDGVALEREGEEIVIRIPMVLKRRQGRKEVIVPEGFDAPGPPKAPAQEPLVRALAKAFAWQDMIETGRFASVTALAQALGVDRSYVRRILGLATLAPDIVEAIVNGREPSGLSLERLTKGMPMGWEEQRGRIRGNRIGLPLTCCHSHIPGRSAGPTFSHRWESVQAFSAALHMGQQSTMASRASPTTHPPEKYRACGNSTFLAWL